MKVIHLNSQAQQPNKLSVVQRLVQQLNNLEKTRLAFLKNNPAYATGGVVA